MLPGLKCCSLLCAWIGPDAQRNSILWFRTWADSLVLPGGGDHAFLHDPLWTLLV